MIKKLITHSTRLVAQQADEAFVEYFIKGKRPGKAERPAMTREQALRFISQLEQVADRYEASDWITDPERFFPAPAAAKPQLGMMRKQGQHELQDLSWPSDYDPIEQDVARVYEAYQANHTARARVWWQGQAHDNAHTIILVHGYAGGQYALEERIWPIKTFLSKGLQVVLFVLPHHGERKAAQYAQPLYPSRDVRLTLEGIRQSVHDLRALMSWLRQRGSTHVGVMGMSLGGYVTSLLATVEPELDFCVPLIPLASFADWAEQMDTLVPIPELRTRHYEAIKRVSACISPLSRPRLITNHHMMILGATSDQVTPLSHAKQLSEHFEAPLKTFQGGHLLQIGRAQVMDEALELIQYACR